jgi:hypothetical protein
MNRRLITQIKKQIEQLDPFSSCLRLQEHSSLQ